MSSPNQTAAPCRSSNLRGTTQESLALNERTTAQSGFGQYQEISRWSPDTSSQAMSASGDMGASTIDSNAATRGSTASSNAPTNTGNNGSIEAERQRTLSALQHGGMPTSESERTAEGIVSQLTQNPQAAQQMSSSGHHARERRS